MHCFHGVGEGREPDEPHRSARCGVGDSTLIRYDLLRVVRSPFGAGAERQRLAVAPVPRDTVLRRCCRCVCACWRFSFVVCPVIRRRKGDFDHGAVAESCRLRLCTYLSILAPCSLACPPSRRRRRCTPLLARARLCRDFCFVGPLHSTYSTATTAAVATNWW